MGPPRRNLPRTPPTKMNPSSSPEGPQSPVSPRPSVSVQQPNLGMTPASRYQHNLKVLRRRDPSIISIFDQFSHVCLYHHNGTKWEKQGYEGSMFLYERDSYPPYGFYILNRMGMDDHIQRLYPEDNIGAHGSYLIIRSYPEFTHRRLAAARSAQLNEPLHNFSDVFAVPNVDQLTAAQKGESKTIGLWMFTTESREPLIDIFTRLHSYIKKNQPYPQEFRYGPDRPPPSSTATIGDVSSYTNGTARTRQALTNGFISPSPGDPKQFQASQSPQIYTNGSTSDLDKLFAKIENTSNLNCATSSVLSHVPNTTSPTTVESLFAALGGKDLMQLADRQGSASIPPASASPESNTNTGISLLDSIFASAKSPCSPNTQPTTQGISSLTPATVFSPVPTSNSFPQVLNQDVIYTLLGLPPSRAPSVASTTYSTGARSHPSSREGDSEGDSDRHGDSDGYSESSTILDPDTALDELHSTGRRPLLTDHGSSSTNGRLRVNGGRTLGSVTPRARMQTLTTPSLSSAQQPQTSRLPSITSPTPPTTEQSPSVSESLSHHPKFAIQTPPSRASTDLARPPVSFETKSDFWPYSRINEGVIGDLEGDDILELDFADTSALSDPDTFQRALKRRKRRALDNHLPRANGVEETNEKSPKKTKKERAAEQAKARQEVENSLDVPKATITQSEEQISPPSPSLSPTRFPVQPKPNAVTSEVPQLQKQKVNGTVPSVTHSAVAPEVVRDCLIAGFINGKPHVTPTLERNDFVREVLTLIHTDKAFVDALYREYTSRIG